MKLQEMTLTDDKKTKWKLSLIFEFIEEESFYVYRDGSSAFTLERKSGEPNTWLVFNDDPEESQYKDRRDYLSALAQGNHQMPCIASRAFPKAGNVAPGASMSEIFEWSIGEYIAHGWTTADAFSDELTTKPVTA